VQVQAGVQLKQSGAGAPVGSASTELGSKGSDMKQHRPALA